MYITIKSGETIGISYGPLPSVGLFHMRYEALVANIVNHLNEIDPDGELLNTLEGPHIG